MEPEMSYLKGRVEPEISYLNGHVDSGISYLSRSISKKKNLYPVDFRDKRIGYGDLGKSHWYSRNISTCAGHRTAPHAKLIFRNIGWNGEKIVSNKEMHALNGNTEDFTPEKNENMKKNFIGDHYEGLTEILLQKMKKKVVIFLLLVHI
jgi:hypothetical protein